LQRLRKQSSRGGEASGDRDAAISNHALRRAKRSGFGRAFRFDSRAVAEA